MASAGKHVTGGMSNNTYLSSALQTLFWSHCFGLTFPKSFVCNRKIGLVTSQNNDLIDDTMFDFLRSGSVQAEIQLETASPNASVVLQVLSSMDNLGNFSLDRNGTAIRSEPGNVMAGTINIYTDMDTIFRHKESTHLR